MVLNGKFYKTNEKNRVTWYLSTKIKSHELTRTRYSFCILDNGLIVRNISRPSKLVSFIFVERYQVTLFFHKSECSLIFTNKKQYTVK